MGACREFALLVLVVIGVPQWAVGQIRTEPQRRLILRHLNVKAAALLVMPLPRLAVWLALGGVPPSPTLMHWEADEVAALVKPVEIMVST